MPDVLLGVEGGEHYGLVVDAGGVLIDGSGGLGAEVAVAGIEVESADVMGSRQHPNACMVLFRSLRSGRRLLRGH